jgi:hypothetical protein
MIGGSKSDIVTDIYAGNDGCVFAGSYTSSNGDFTLNRGGKDAFIGFCDKDGNLKYDSVTGAKGYRWLESEMVRKLGKEDTIDRGYYNALVDAAVETISQFGNFEYFASDDPYVGPPFLDGKPLYYPLDLPVDDPTDVPW